MKRKQFNWITCGTLIACILAFMVMIFSIYSAITIYNQAEMIYDHPYQVKSATQEMKTRMYDTGLALSTLLTIDSEAEDIDLHQWLQERDTLQEHSLAVIEERYLGPKEDLAALSATLTELQAARYASVEQFSGKARISDVLEYFEREITPHTEAMDAALTHISNYADSRVVSFEQTARNMRNTTIVVSVSFCLLIIALVILTTVSERRKNAEIHNRNRLFDLLSTNIDDAFYIYNVADGSPEYVSENFSRVLGLDRKQFYKNVNLFHNFLTPESAATFEQFEANEHLLENRECEVEFLSPSKQAMTLKVYMYPVKSGYKTTRCIIFISDETRTIEQRNTLSDALTNAQKANSAKRDFLSRMSHEIRTPINTIIGMTAIAVKHMDDRQYIENSLTKISAASSHLLALINDILDMSKIEDNKLPINRETFDLNTLIQSLTTIVYPQTLERHQKFEVTVTHLDHEILIGDPLRVNQILLNILSNAVKFTPEGGTIRMRIVGMNPKQNRIRLRFIIEDNGIGMSKEYLQRLYTPFEQADSNIAQKYGGTGLGMSITKNLVSLMDGVITVESEPERGTRFTIELPFTLPEKAVTTYKSDEFENLNVLVVDDDETTCEHASSILKHMGINANWVNSGIEAVQLVIQAYERGNGYDVCLIDWLMPDMDGLTTVKNIRRYVGPDTLLIIISAYDWSAIEREAREAGVNAFIPKPLFASNIYDCLNTVVAPKQAVADKSDSQSKAYDFHGKKILLAEDNEINQEIAVALLSDIGLVIDCAENGQVALEMFEQSAEQEYALIFMDIQMPVLDGYQTARAIRASAHPEAKTIPIIAMTANAFSEDVASAKEAGMNDHVAKPINVETLYKTVEVFVR